MYVQIRCLAFFYWMEDNSTMKGQSKQNQAQQESVETSPAEGRRRFHMTFKVQSVTFCVLGFRVCGDGNPPLISDVLSDFRLVSVPIFRVSGFRVF